MNRENMEKWVEALEQYEGELAYGAFEDDDGARCALGVGVAQVVPNSKVSFDKIGNFYKWLDMDPVRHDGSSFMAYDVALKPDGSGYDFVSHANDHGNQSAWDIAQRLRETYLKEES